jgi:uncharacterized lipoprotein YajG
MLVTLLTATLAPLAHARGNLKELMVPLKFTPQEGVHTSNPDLQSGLLTTSVELKVEDARKLADPLVIGQGTGGDDKSVPIHADRSVTAFVQESFAGMAKDWGLKQDPPPARTLTVRLTRLNVDEANKALGSIYATEVKVAYALKDARGSVLVEGATSGTAHRYGHAHSPDNINEVLSDALKEAFANVLADTSLQTAWVSGKRTTAVAAAKAEAQESVEERLRKLDDLLKKGLITKEEYQKKRAEILKDI